MTKKITILFIFILFINLFIFIPNSFAETLNYTFTTNINSYSNTDIEIGTSITLEGISANYLSYLTDPNNKILIITITDANPFRYLFYVITDYNEETDYIFLERNWAYNTMNFHCYNPSKLIIFAYNPSTGVWQYSSASFGIQYDSARLIYSNVNIYSDIEKSDYFFQLPLPVVFQLEMMGEVIQSKNPLEEIITILPLIIVVVASLVGFRKALVLLENFLRRS